MWPLAVLNGVAALTRFSYKKMCGCFVWTNRDGVVITKWPY